MEDDTDIPELVVVRSSRPSPSLNNPNNRKVPITILTGFLGAGKSTLLNEILTRKDLNTRFAVIMNEFGDTAEIEKAVSIQRAGEEAAEEWLELPNGCLCCTIKTTALQAIESLLIRKSGHIDYILLETTGLADPYPIINSFWADEALECRAYLDGVVCLVDGKNISEQVREWRVLMQQIVLADVIVINKTDLMGESNLDLNSLKDWLQETNPLAKIKTCQYGQFQDYSTILDLKAYGAVDCTFTRKKGKGYLELMASLDIQEKSQRHHSDVRSLRLSTRKPIDRAKFEKWLFKLLWSESDKFKILRAKGLLTCSDGREIVLQSVQELYEITELEKINITGSGESVSVLVLLGWFEDDFVMDSIRESFYNEIWQE